MKAILTYHSIDDSGSVVSVSPAEFERHVEWVSAAGIPTVTVDAVHDPTCTEGIAFTFDDGFENFATEAWPRLQARGLTATVYVVSGRVGLDNGWDPDDPRIPRLPLMSWDTLGRLHESGIALGGHTRAHPDLRALSSERLHDEVAGDRSTLESKIGIAPTSFAYPYGHLNAAAVAEVGACGYESAVTTEYRLLEGREADPLRLPRLDAFYLREPGRLERWGTARFRNDVRFTAMRRRARRVLQTVGVVR